MTGERRKNEGDGRIEDIMIRRRNKIGNWVPWYSKKESWLYFP